ncbi:hypothetical protein [Paracraurococcus lichenis]|uniref:Lipoprotein n=1 Tax=Paracraurococcus lichenis TaxID=3064888 RepID=A0ABT9E1I8_9PROT|nr:hypothetical protein [Paracraurococcus sp. LOR1-02]MDO9710009.1 hypothetical protein [Paracraurococcus sp. LOR1-02]
MPAARRLLALLAPCLLAACVNETVIPQATDAPGPARPAAAAAPAAGPVTAYDGRYAGTITLNPDRTRACPAAPREQREITVRQGRASFLIVPQTRQTLNGVVGPAGDVRMADTLDRTIATTGAFAEGRFLGEHRNGLCSYAVSMTKQE